jgi:hypothetical protein
VLENVMRAADALQNPAFAFKAALYVTAIGEHHPQIALGSSSYSTHLSHVMRGLGPDIHAESSEIIQTNESKRRHSADCGGKPGNDNLNGTSQSSVVSLFEILAPAVEMICVALSPSSPLSLVVQGRKANFRLSNERF